ncbi:hypothetical protein F4818DRAFT_452989 [Hypoxylon cercidicola]|nr:hypothetical protein F4818DRAFT_452989 [Hypoxylon cercidicola]
MGDYHQSFFKRPVFSPTPSKTPLSESNIASLPDLVRFNARENPHHVFALQSEINHDAPTGRGGNTYKVSQITFEQLEILIRRCVGWMRNTVASLGDNGDDRRSPVALYLESDIGLFIYLVALLSIDVPILLISARLSSPSVLHLLKETKAKTILVSRRTQTSLSQDIQEAVNVQVVEPYHALIKSDTIDETDTTWRDGQQGDGTEVGSVILHSSGTTGLPKPILLTQRYLLGYAACHQFAPEEYIDWVSLSTLPLYHGFGLLAPCLSLSVGMTCCLPPASVIPATKSTLDLLRTFKCRSLMTVPSIVDDILSLLENGERQAALQLLARLEFLAVGGGALRPQNGLTLAQHKVKLLNHYGATELGAIAPIFRPGPDYNWRYLRLRSDLGLEVRPIPDSDRFRLVGFPIGWDKPFEVQDELERNPDSPLEIRILGRTDDLIVLKTGEKVQPRQLEEVLNADPAIRAAVCIGSGFFELAVIIDPVNEDSDEKSIKDHVWELVTTANSTLDHHARITSKKAIIIKPRGASIPRSDKGSVMRRGVHEIFKKEIEDAYAAMESESLGEGFELDPADMESGIRHLIATVASNRMDSKTMDPDKDFFESGMDSLQSVLLARLLSSALRTRQPADGNEMPKLTVDFIYQNSSIRKLAAVSARLVNLEDKNQPLEQHDRLAEITAVANKFLARADEAVQRQAGKHVILMTGSTGNLGAHTLARFARAKTVRKIICLIRNTSASQSDNTASKFLVRQQRALEAAGIHFGPEQWAKVELLSLGSVFGSNETDRSAQLSYLASQVTHILHLAWPMDFHRTLQSFEPHIELVQKLVELAQQSQVTRQATEPVRLLFSSSIAVVRYVGDSNSDGQVRQVVPESVMEDPRVSVPMGYAEAKWVCETVLNRIGERVPEQVEPVVVRIGQLSGPEGTSGVWKTEEHLPTLVQASQRVGAFPLLEGDMSWIPVDRAAQSLVEMTLHKGKVERFVHLENPVRQSISNAFTIMGYEMRLSSPILIPYEQWVKRAAEVGAIRSLELFFRDHFRDLAEGGVILDTTKARVLSKTLTGSGGVSRELIIEYLNRWRRDGFLK